MRRNKAFQGQLEQLKRIDGRLELAKPMFDRMKREARVTAYGEVFLRRAQRVLDEVDAAKREASEAKDLLMGKLTLGILPTMAPYLLPRVMVRFLKDFPGVEVVVQEDTTERLLKQALYCGFCEKNRRDGNHACLV